MSEFPLDCLRNLVCDDNLSFMETLDEGQMKLIVTSPPLQFRQGLRKENILGCLHQAPRARDREVH